MPDKDLTLQTMLYPPCDTRLPLRWRRTPRVISRECFRVDDVPPDGDCMFHVLSTLQSGCPVGTIRCDDGRLRRQVVEAVADVWETSVASTFAISLHRLDTLFQVQRERDC